jgi:hypothetical protein
MKRGGSIGHGQLILSAVVCGARTVLECTYLLYWDVRRAFFWKFCFLTVVATMRTDDLWGLAWAKYQATKYQADREKVQPRHSLETLECVTALSFFQEICFSVRAKPHKTTVRTPIVMRSLHDVFTF